MSATTLEVNTSPGGPGPITLAALAAVLLVECHGLKSGKDAPTVSSYVASLKQLALSRLRAALLQYKGDDHAALLACADVIATHRHLPPMMRLHLAPALRAVTSGELAAFVAAEFVTACINAEGRDDLVEIATASLSELSGAVDDLADAVRALH